MLIFFLIIIFIFFVITHTYYLSIRRNYSTSTKSWVICVTIILIANFIIAYKKPHWLSYTAQISIIIIIGAYASIALEVYNT